VSNILEQYFKDLCGPDYDRVLEETRQDGRTRRHAIFDDPDQPESRMRRAAQEAGHPRPGVQATESEEQDLLDLLAQLSYDPGHCLCPDDDFCEGLHHLVRHRNALYRLEAEPCDHDGYGCLGACHQLDGVTLTCIRTPRALRAFLDAEDAHRWQLRWDSYRWEEVPYGDEALRVLLEVNVWPAIYAASARKQISLAGPRALPGPRQMIEQCLADKLAALAPWQGSMEDLAAETDWDSGAQKLFYAIEPLTEELAARGVVAWRTGDRCGEQRRQEWAITQIETRPLSPPVLRIEP
jgi:hypothetical protein